MSDGRSNGRACSSPGRPMLGAQAYHHGRSPVRVIGTDRERTYNGFFSLSALNPHFMQIRARGAAIWHIEGPITLGVTKRKFQRKFQLHARPLFADNIRWQKRYPRGSAAVKEKEVRGERFAASNFAFYVEAARRSGGEHKRGPKTCR